MSAQPEHPTAFITYAQTDPSWTDDQATAWREEVGAFAAVLRGYGIDAKVDLFALHEPGVDWTRFGSRAVIENDWVIAAISPAWRERYEGGNNPVHGAGAVAEADALISIFQDNQSNFRSKLILAFLPTMRCERVPVGLHGVRRFRLEDFNQASLEDLLRLITNQPRYPAPPLGRVPDLAPATPTGSAVAPAPDPLPSPPAVSALADGDASGDRLREIDEQIGALRAALQQMEPPGAGDGPHLPWYRAWHQLQVNLANLEADRAEIAPDEPQRQELQDLPSGRPVNTAPAVRSMPLATERDLLDAAIPPPGAPEHRSVHEGMLLLRIVARPTPADRPGPIASQTRVLLAEATSRMARYTHENWRPAAGDLLFSALRSFEQPAPRLWHAGRTTGDADALAARPTAAVALSTRPLVLTVDRTHPTGVPLDEPLFYAAHDPEIAADTTLTCLLVGHLFSAVGGVSGADVLVQIAAAPSGETLVGADAYNPAELAFDEPTDRISPRPPFAASHYLGITRADTAELVEQPEAVAVQLLDDWLSMFRSRDVFEDLRLR